MIEAFLTPHMAPYTLAFALLMGLVCLELFFALLGLSLMGDGGDADFDVSDFAPEAVDLGDPGLDIDVDALDGVDIDELELPAFEAEVADASEGADGGALGWLGMGKAPFVLWLASLLLGFGVTGVVLVNVVQNLMGFTLPLWGSLPVSAVVAVGFARRFGAVFARLLPKTETSALSRNRLARRRGVVSQGTARRDHPAEVRVTDYFGNLHYIRAEPLQDASTMPQGTEVLVVRHRPSGGYRLIALTE